MFLSVSVKNTLMPTISKPAIPTEMMSSTSEKPFCFFILIKYSFYPHLMIARVIRPGDDAGDFVGGYSWWRFFCDCACPHPNGCELQGALKNLIDRFYS